MTFIGFSSRKNGKITLKNTRNVTGVKAEIREPILSLTVAEYELTAEQIAAGEFTVPTVEAGDIYMAHMAEYDAKDAFPEDLELHVTVRYDSAEGEKTLEYSVKDVQEQGWGVMYWPDDEPANEWNRPGYFRFTTYESTTPVSLVMDEPERVVTSPENTVLSVSLSIDGRKILPEECEIQVTREEDPFAEFNEPGTETRWFYHARIFLKRPAWAPEHGTIHMTVVQQLSDGRIWTTEEDKAY